MCVCVVSSGMPLHVQSQVVGAGEGPLAQHTLVRFLARVLAVVTRQLVGAGELPAAVLPWTLVWLLAWREGTMKQIQIPNRV